MSLRARLARVGPLPDRGAAEAALEGGASGALTLPHDERKRLADCAASASAVGWFDEFPG